MDKQSQHSLAEKYSDTVFTVSLSLPPNLSLSFPLSVWPGAEGLLSALSLGHQAAIVASATDLRVLGQGGRGSRGGGWNRGSVG